MAKTRVPSVAELKLLTGRLARSVSGKRDLDPILQPLERLRSAPARSRVAIDPAQAVWSLCVAWLKQNRTAHRITSFWIHDLLSRSYAAWVEAIEANTLTLKGPPSPVIPPRPSSPGNEMRPKYRDEMKAPHLTPKTYAVFAGYRANGGTLNQVDWATLIIAPTLEVDPSGDFIADGRVRPRKGPGEAPQIKDSAVVTQGVTYCEEDERAAFRIEVRNGRLYNADGEPFDTQAMQVSDYGYGWAMFVLGYDERLYASSEVRDFFHHSSFFQGAAVRCAGELCCIEGRLRFMTGKAGHYRPGLPEICYFARWLLKAGVDLTNLPTVVEPKDKDYKWFDAAMLAALPSGTAKLTAAPIASGLPATLHAPGQPQIGEAGERASAP